MTAKEYLKQYDMAKKRANILKAEYEKEMLQIDAIRSSSDIDGMPHSTGINKSVEDKAIRLADKALAWKSAELDALRLRQQIFDLIYRLPSPESEILYERYIELCTWANVSRKVSLSWSAVRKHHNAALDMVKIKIAEKEQQVTTIV